MNCWGFGSDFLSGLDDELRLFLKTRMDEPKAEFYLPAAVSNLVGQGRTHVSVLPTTSTWFGVTYREDRPRVARAVAALIENGIYPQTLF